MNPGESKSRFTYWAPALASTLLIFLVGLDQIQMPIASAAISKDLNSSVGSIQFALALVSLVAAPLYVAGGKLGDVRGKKRIFIFGLMLYGIGTLAATIAPSISVLIIGWSVIRALGMVLTIPASIGLLIANYDDDTRGQAFAIYGVGGVAAALVGPLLMGFSAEQLSWRVPFGIGTGLVILALLLTRSLDETDIVEGVRIDWAGTALMFFAVGSFILGSMLGGRYGWWMPRRPFEIGDTQINPFDLSPAPLLIVLGVVIIALTFGRFYRMEERGEQPLFSLTIYDNRTFLISFLMMSVFLILSGALPFIIPVFLQQAVGFDSLQAAYAMIALSIGSVVLGLVSGTLVTKLQSRTLMQIFIVVTGIGAVWLAAVTSLDMTVATLLVPMFIIGAGLGVITSQGPNIMLSTLAPEQTGEGSGLGETGKELGIGLGTAIIGSMLFSLAIGGMVDNIAKESGTTLTPGQRSELIIQIEDLELPENAEEEINNLLPEDQQILSSSIEEGWVNAMQLTLGALVAILLVALVLASFLPKVETDDVASEEVKELAADVSSRRI